MRIKLRGVFLAGFFAVYPAHTYATPSTQIWIPSTDFQAFGIAHFGADTYNCIGRRNSSRTVATINYGLTVGVVPDHQKIAAEVGIDYRDTGGYTHKPWYFNAKIGIKEGMLIPQQPALAIGGFDFGGNKPVSDANIIYALAAKTIGGFGRCSVGYFSGNDKVLVDENGGKENTGFLASWDRTLGKGFWAAVDYMGSESSYGALSFGISYALSNKSSFIIGYDVYNNSKLHSPTLTFQLDVNF